MHKFFAIGFSLCLLLASPGMADSTLPFETVFKGRPKFDALLTQADSWKGLPIGERGAAVGKALRGTPYKGFTLEIDNHIEAASVNFDGLDCWTFFETSLAFARMLEEPKEKWTPATFLHYIELDRYRGGKCDHTYLSRLHYLEDWLHDNASRGLVEDLTKKLGGVRATNSAEEMTVHWRSYRYMKNNPQLRTGIRQMEENVANLNFYHIPKAKVGAIESQLQTGDIIGITTYDGRKIGTSHVGIAVKQADGVHFMHASAPYNYGKVVIDSRLPVYLARYRSDAGIIVARPLK